MAERMSLLPRAFFEVSLNLKTCCPTEHRSGLDLEGHGFKSRPPTLNTKFMQQFNVKWGLTAY